MTSRPAFHPLRHTLFATVALAAVAGGCDCGGPGIRDAEPRLVVDPTSYEIEGVPGKFTELVLKATNEGSSLLTFESVEILDEDGDAFNEFAIVQQFVEDCEGTIRPEAGRNELQPSACAVLRFRYLPQGDGLDKGAIVLHSNDPENPSLRVPINGNAQTPNLEVCAYEGDTEIGCSTTGALFEVDFGNPSKGTTVSRTLKLKSKGSRTLSIEKVTYSGDDDFVVTPLPYEKELAAGTEDSLNVDFSALVGGAREGLLVISSNDPAEERLSVRLRAIGDGSKMCLCITNQAGSCRPTTLADFGRTAIGGTGTREMWITNCGNKPMEFQGMEFVSGEPLFGASFPTLPRTQLPTDEKIVVPLTFSPVAAERSEGRINLITHEEQGFITLSGEGYESGCKLVAAASVVDFGSAGVFPQNPATQKRVTFANQGDEACEIKLPNATTPTDGVHISAGADVAFKMVGFPSNPVVPPATTVAFNLEYAPADLNGPDTGELTVPYSGEAPGSPTSTLKVDLKGTPVADPVCVLTVAPTGGMFGSTLNFGQVRVHTEKVLPATFTNVGSANCVLSNARIAGGGGLPGLPNDAPYFKVKNIPNGPILPGQSATVDVAFKPDSDRDYGMALPMGGSFPIGGVSLMVNTNDVVTFDGSDPLNGCTGGFGGGQAVPGCVKWGLSGSGAKSDLAALPGDIDFGLVTLGCRSREMTITLYNIGTIDTTITEIVVDPSSTPQIFHVVSPPMPVTLTGGQQLQLTVRYRPPDEGIHTASILIKSDATNATVTNPYITVGLRGEGTTETHQTDVFDQSNRPKSDVLFVIDDSGSMSEEQNALASNAQRFINVATSLNTDFQIGVITTDADTRPGQLRGTPKIIANGANAASDFSKTVRDLGTNGSGTEKGLQVMVDALSPPTITDPNINGGFLRSDAKLAVVVVSDEDDFSNGTVDFYTDFLKNIKGIHNQGLVTLSAIVGEPGGCSTAAAGDRYIAVQQRTNGKFRSICSSDWGQIAGDLGLDAFGARAGFPLSRVAVPTSIEVKVNGQPSTRPEWSYDAPSNSVVFDAAHLPDAGAAVIIDYEAACL